MCRTYVLYDTSGKIVTLLNTYSLLIGTRSFVNYRCSICFVTVRRHGFARINLYKQITITRFNVSTTEVDFKKKIRRRFLSKYTRVRKCTRYEASARVVVRENRRFRRTGAKENTANIRQLFITPVVESRRVGTFFVCF